MDRRRARAALKEFEQLIRDGIALLVQRGEIKIPPESKATAAAQPANKKTVTREFCRPSWR